MTDNKRRSPNGPGRSERRAISIEQFMDAIPDEESARRWLERMRWGGGRYCPRCFSHDVYATRSGKPMPYRCRDCEKYFSVRTNTVMANSKLPHRKWAIALYLELTSLKGVSSLKLHRDIGVTQKTAWYLGHRIRQGYLEVTGDEWTKLSGVLEADETYIGGLEKKKHGDKKLRAGRGTVGKTVVAGLRSRETGEVRMEVVPNAQGRTLRAFVRRHAEPGSTIYTDESPSYEGMPEYEHASVAHSRGEYVRGDVSTNYIESAWAPIKRAHKGTFHSMSPKHMQRYIDEFAGKNNMRHLDTSRQMQKMVRGLDRRRLTYRDLIQ